MIVCRAENQGKEKLLCANEFVIILDCDRFFGQTYSNNPPTAAVCTAITATVFRHSCLKILGFERTFDTRTLFSDSSTRTDRVDQDRASLASSELETEDAEHGTSFHCN